MRGPGISNEGGETVLERNDEFENDTEQIAAQLFERALHAVDIEEELRCYNEAIRLKPDDAEAYYNRGLVLHDKGVLDGARQDYDMAIRLRPDFAEAYNNRGVVRSIDTGRKAGMHPAAVARSNRLWDGT